MEKKFDVICMGVGCYDICLQHIPSDLLEKDVTQLNKITLSTGGDALNATVDLTRLGAKAALLAVLGTDPFGKTVMNDLLQKGIDTSVLSVRDDYETCVSFVMIEPNGERHFTVKYEGNLLPLHNSDISDDFIRSTKHIHAASLFSLGSMDDELAELFERCHKLGVTTSMDSGTPKDGIWFPRIKETIKHTDIFFPSHYEAAEFCGTTDLLEMKEFFRDKGVKIFGVKCGGDGIFVTDYKEDIFMKPLYNGEPVDTTGAGDAFCATFVAGIVRGMSLRDAAALGQAQSAHIISKIGANTGATDIHTLVKYCHDFGYDIDIK